MKWKAVRPTPLGVAPEQCSCPGSVLARKTEKELHVLSISGCYGPAVSVRRSARKLTFGKRADRELT